MSFALSILPIILTIAGGYFLTATRVLPADRWGGIEVLSFRLLIPVVIINAIADSEFSLAEFGPMVINLVLTLTIAGLLVFALRRLIDREHLPDPAFTTLFQTTIRWNAFIALAAAEQFIGPKGLSLIAVAMACLIPLINVVNIVVLAIFGTRHATVRGVGLLLIKNPLLQACMIGLAINLSGVTLPATVLRTLELIGRAAIGVGLLSVGAGISLGRLLKISPQVWLGVVLRLGICPGVFILLANLAALSPIQTTAGALVLAVPAAANGYIVARQMGGDAELYTDILIWQTFLSMLLLPALAVWLAAP